MGKIKHFAAEVGTRYMVLIDAFAALLALDVHDDAGAASAANAGGDTTSTAPGNQTTAPGASASGANPPATPGGETGAVEPTFDELLKDERYRSEYDKRMQDAVKKRVGEAKTLQSKLDAAKPILDAIALKYGASADDLAALAKAVENDDAIYTEAAYAAGMGVPEFKAIKKVEADNARLNAALQAQYQEQQNRARLDAYFNEANETMKPVYPDFDLEAEIRSPTGETFARMLNSGVTMRNAYEALHIGDIITDVAQVASQRGADGAIANVQRRASRPAENGTGNKGGAAQVKTDYSKLTLEQREELMRRSAYEKIT
jgi:hypothetical protein